MLESQERTISVAENGVEELWRPIPSLPGYSASSLGRIRGPRTILKPRHNVRHGYLMANVSHNGKTATRNVHALVAEAFHGPAKGRRVKFRKGKEHCEACNLYYAEDG